MRRIINKYLDDAGVMHDRRTPSALAFSASHALPFSWVPACATSGNMTSAAARAMRDMVSSGVLDDSGGARR